VNDLDYYLSFLYILLAITCITWIAFSRLFIKEVDDKFDLDFTEQNNKNKREKI